VGARVTHDNQWSRLDLRELGSRMRDLRTQALAL
jgi:hypothetical protein